MRHDTPRRLCARAFSIRISSGTRALLPDAGGLLVQERDADVLAVLALRHVEHVHIVGREELVDVLFGLLHEATHDETAQRHRISPRSATCQSLGLTPSFGNVAALA